MGKLEMAMIFDELVGSELLSATNLDLLPITLEDTKRLTRLAYPDPSHRDPFDRLLVAQALQRNLALVSNDKQLDAYGVQRIW